MKWEQCRSELVRMGIDIPEEFDKPALQEWIAQIEEDPYASSAISDKVASVFYSELCEAVKEYYDLPEEDPEYGS